MKPEELKSAQTRLKILADEISAGESEIRGIMQTMKDHRASIDRMQTQSRALAQSLDVKRAEIVKIKDQIERKVEESKKVVVSEHAILRYVERVIWISIEELAQRVLPKEIESVALTMGDGVYAVDQTHRVRIRNGVAVTVLADGEE